MPGRHGWHQRARRLIPTASDLAYEALSGGMPHIRSCIPATSALGTTIDGMLPLTVLVSGLLFHFRPLHPSLRLAVPTYVSGRQVGTMWILAHDATRHLMPRMYAF